MGNHPYRACHRCGLVHEVGQSILKISPYTSWRCSRCDATFPRLIDSQISANRTMALAVGALVFFIPAVWLPLLTIERMGIRHRTSLLQGTWELLHEGNFFVGVVVLVFSILLPVTKLVGLIELSWWGVLKKHHQATLLRMVEFAGRWSMLDVLLLALLVMSVKVGELVSFHFGPAVFAFVVCVILNMMASLSFDPHSIWDRPMKSNYEMAIQSSESNTIPLAIPLAIQSTPAINTSMQQNAMQQNAMQQNARRISKWWLLTAASTLVAIGLILWTIGSRGPSIQIHFRDGFGIRSESLVLHRGIEVGSVTSVELDPKNEGVIVAVQLSKKAAVIATKGSQFWIERPQVSTRGVKGLDTIVSGRYIAVALDKSNGKKTARSSFSDSSSDSKRTPQMDFIGLESAPVEETGEGAIEIMLESSDRFGLQNDAPVIYRGVEVGRVLSVGLSRDGRWFQARASIHSQFRELIRENTVFWNRSGLRVNIGLGGVDVDAESMSAIAAGGVEFATPNEPGPMVRTGRRFEMFREPNVEWAQWRPRLIHGVGSSSLVDGYPTPYRLTLRWQESFFGLRQNKEANGWVLLLDNGKVLGLRDLLSLPNKAIPESVHWEIAGVRLNQESIAISELTGPESEGQGKQDWVAASITKLPNELDRWPIARVIGLLPQIKPKTKTDTEVYNMVIVDGPPSFPIPLESFQLQSRESEIRTPLPTMGLSEAHHGLPVLDMNSATVVGLIQYDRERSEASLLWIH